MRSQIGWVARLPITADSKSMWVGGPASRLGDTLVTLPPQPLGSNSGWPTESGYRTESLGVSGRILRGRAVSELWGDFDWDDAA